MVHLIGSHHAQTQFAVMRSLLQLEPEKACPIRMSGCSQSRGSHRIVLILSDGVHTLKLNARVFFKWFLSDGVHTLRLNVRVFSSGAVNGTSKFVRNDLNIFFFCLLLVHTADYTCTSFSLLFITLCTAAELLHRCHSKHLISNS